MEYCGIIALVLLLCYSAYPGKVKRLESKVKRLEKKQKGDNYMSQLIDDLVGEQCTIKSEAILNFAGKTEFLFCVTTQLKIFYKQEIAEKKYYRSNPIFFSALHNNILTNREVAYKIVNVKGVIRRTYGGLFYN